MSDDAAPPARQHRPESWRSPCGIGAMASVVGVLIAIIALVAGAGGVGLVLSPERPNDLIGVFVAVSV